VTSWWWLWYFYKLDFTREFFQKYFTPLDHSRDAKHLSQQDRKDKFKSSEEIYENNLENISGKANTVIAELNKKHKHNAEYLIKIPIPTA